MRNALVLISAVAILAVLNWLVWQKEQTVSKGRTVLLQLAPRDPRSLMQGDYMILRYTIAGTLNSETLESKGKLVIKLDANQVGTVSRMDDGKTPPAADECLLIYRRRGEMRLGAESFLFQEGDAELYTAARYGELKVDAEGNSVLVGLRDEKLAPLGKSVVK